MLVSTVTRDHERARAREVAAALHRRLARGLIIARPPDACTLTIHAPSRVAARHGAGDGVGDVVEFQVEKDADRPSSASCSDERRPLAREETAADLESADDAAQFVGERTCAAEVSTSSATRS